MAKHKMENCIRGTGDKANLSLNLFVKITLLDISLWTLRHFGNDTSNGYISTKD
jgi:hypothetical protein